MTQVTDVTLQLPDGYLDAHNPLASGT